MWRAPLHESPPVKGMLPGGRSVDCDVLRCIRVEITGAPRSAGLYARRPTKNCLPTATPAECGRDFSLDTHGLTRAPGRHDAPSCARREQRERGESR
jgi:hypothetical protein